jgi:hypothetical protein
MRIETEPRRPVSRSPLRIAAAIVACCAAFFAAGYYFFQYKAAVGNAIGRALGLNAGKEATGLYATVPDGLKHAGKDDKTAPDIPGLKRLYIKVKHNDFESLRIQKEMSLKKGAMVRFEDPWVKAEISSDDRNFLKAKLRLRGLMADHVGTGKDSYRIELARNAVMFGMHEFSVHHPWMRNYLHEKFVQAAMKREGLPFLRYEFVHVTVNDVAKGIYALEENFDKLLVANNQLPDGPILDFSNASTENRAVLFAPGVGGGVRKSKALFSEYEKAATLLHRFLIGELEASQVFDVGQVALYCALTDLTASYHGAHFSSVRFYYNPTTSRFQFLPYDATSNFVFDYLIGAGRSLYRTSSPADSQSPFFKQLFDDTRFYRLYVQALEKVSAAGYVDALVADLKPQLLESERIIRSEWPDYGFFDKWYFTAGGTSSAGFLHSNAQRIREALDVSRSVEAHLTGISPQALTVSLANTSKVPVEVLGVTRESGPMFGPAAAPLILAPLADGDVPAYHRHRFSGNRGPGASAPANPKDRLFVTYRPLGGSAVHRKQVENASYDPEDLPRLVSDLRAMPWLRVDDKARMVFVAPGKHTLDKPLSLPEGYSLGIGPATTIQLVKKAFILVSKGRFVATGAEAAPVVIESPDGTGAGLAVLNADEPSSLSNVIFNNLRNPAAKGWDLTGCVTFYESPVAIANTRFVNCAAEDSLHVLRTRFSLNGVTFEGAHSDAFDGDFVQGSITDSAFLNSGNDGIDISGSKVTVDNVVIEGSGDKGVSVGEQSHADLRRVRISNSNIGIASKDRSSTTIDGLSISGGNIGLTVFQKKPEFGPGNIVAKNVAITGNKQPYLVESGSAITVDGKPAATNAEALRGTLYQGKKER